MIKDLIKSPYKKFVGYLRSGLAPRELSAAIAWGTFWGTFPIPGTSTTLSAITALWFKLNMGVIQALNYGLTVVYMLVLVPFSMLGARVLNIDIEPITLHFFIHSFEIGWWHGIQATAAFLGHSVVGWLVVMPAFSYLLFLITHAMLRKKAKLPMQEAVE